MIKRVFTMSVILSFIGIIILSSGFLIQEIFPKLAYMVLKSKNPFLHITLHSYYRFGYVCLFFGIINSIYFYTKGRKEELNN